MRSNKISKQFRNPYGVRSGGDLMKIMDAYRAACEKEGRYLTYSNAKGGKNKGSGVNMSTTIPEPWFEDMEKWTSNYRNVFGKAFIDACEWYVKNGG